MKKLFLLFLFTIPLLARADVFTARIDTSATNLSSSFSGTNGAVLFENAGVVVNPRVINTIYIDNRQGNEIIVNCSTGPSLIPIDSSVHNISVAGNESWSLPDATGFGNACYIRTFSGTLSSGIIVITAIGY